MPDPTHPRPAPPSKRGEVVWWPTASSPHGIAERLRIELAVGLRAAISREEAADWAARVRAARAQWHADFGGEQFTLGRAFYAHLEEDRLNDYFAEARGANEEVERAVPGLQARMRQLIATITGERVTSRPDFCGPGVHIFPAHEKVARLGGVVHFDLEGLPRSFLTSGRRAITAVLMLESAELGGGLRLWSVRYDPHTVTDEARAASEAGVGNARVLRAAPGDVVFFDSFVLHQIEPFSGAKPRVSATVHAMQIATGAWETWF
jgi:hypothetical protein